MIGLPPVIGIPARPTDPASPSACARVLWRCSDLLRALTARLEVPAESSCRAGYSTGEEHAAWRTGRAATQAVLAEQAHLDRLAGMADAFAVVAAALEGWALTLAQLVIEREALAARIDEHHRRIAVLAGMPDGVPGAATLRAEATRDGLDLTERLRGWKARVERARDEAAATLRWQTDLAPATDRARREIALATNRAIDAGAAAGAVVRLVDYDSAAFGGDGAVAIAFDEPASPPGTTAIDHTAVVVPGITNDASSIDAQSISALALLGAASPAAGRTSVIAWMGYDAPSHPALQGERRLAPRELRDLGRTLGDGAAEDGGRRLVGFVGDLRSAGPGTQITTIGHSYGSTTAAHAAVGGLDTDNLVLVGSPGAGRGIDEAADLGLPATRVFVGAADNDPVTWIGGGRLDVLGADPAHESFGGTRIPVAPGPPVHLDDPGQLVLNHNSYFSPGSTSLDALTAITVGEAPSTVPGRTQTGPELFAGWAVREAAYTVKALDVGVLWR